MQVQRTKRLMNPDLFKKGKIVPSERTTNLKLEKFSPSKSGKMIAECERLTTAFDEKFKISDSNLRKIHFERLAKRISNWEKRADAFVNLEMQVLKKMDPSNPAYKRIHLLINKFTILHTLIQMAEKSGDLPKGYTQRALNTGLKK